MWKASTRYEAVKSQSVSRWTLRSTMQAMHFMADEGASLDPKSRKGPTPGVSVAYVAGSTEQCQKLAGTCSVLCKLRVTRSVTRSVTHLHISRT